MNFTDLEYVLMIAVFALLWRNGSAKLWARSEEHRANKYANWLVAVSEKRGKICYKDDSYYFEETKQ